jgi:hypothetical protein
MGFRIVAMYIILHPEEDECKHPDDLTRVFGVWLKG